MKSWKCDVVETFSLRAKAESIRNPRRVGLRRKMIRAHAQELHVILGQRGLTEGFQPPSSKGFLGWKSMERHAEIFWAIPAAVHQTFHRSRYFLASAENLSPSQMGRKERAKNQEKNTPPLVRWSASKIASEATGRPSCS